MTEYIIDWDTSLVIDTFSKNNLREEIVRCRDCRLQDEFKYCDRLGFKVGDNGFCAWRKRRDADKRSTSKERAIEGVLMYLIDSSNTVEFDAMTAIEKATRDIMEIMGGESRC